MDASKPNGKEKRMRDGQLKLALGLLASATLFLSGSPQVQATSIPWGDPVIGHSWDQLWVETLDRNFDALTAKTILPPGSEFEAPGFLGFSVDGWAVTSMTSRDLSAQGPDTARLEFKTHFSGLPTDYSPENLLVFDMRFFDNGQQVDAQRWIWDGSSWVDPPAPTTVPDGGMTLLLLGLSSLGVVWLRKKLG
jgi:hypothetical protein